ncbi:MAG TPA: Y-family DNA polymerase [Caldisericia bacterium]|mgnify:FL=1|nr:Y-family DNA polymerase [Caldisericia bacterium]HPF48530.1 Y-family DNA polymerase [Caldisericia bacterium]HPI84600.1 Y-family DNA polymerase [Caldisericia bacterium]HPQ92985.1 Y-family DNA polymerase [Caldisericia bacterium]
MGSSDQCDTSYTRRKSYALLDCDSFYASCEKVFRPDLVDRPVVVLSNNDGFIIAACRKAKALGIKVISDPYFKVEPFVKKHNMAVFSANFELYGDMSRRVMGSLRDFVKDVEVYSIDEAFMILEGINMRHANYCRFIRKKIAQWYKLPVSVGIGPTKTLAKIANRIAKKTPEFEGVFDIGEQDIDAFLERFPVEDIWGVGRAYSKFLQSKGITNSLQLKNVSDDFARQHMTVVGLRTVKELQGIPCFELDQSPPPQKNITRSRSFGFLVETHKALAEATAAYMARACEKLREQRSVAWVVSVFISTHPHKEEPQYSNFAYTRLPLPTADTPTLIRAALKVLKRIYKPGYRYLRCGVILSDLISEADAPRNLFTTPYPDSRTKDLMNSIDLLNKNMQPGIIKFGSVGLEGKPWKMRQAHRSPRYTTRFEEIPKAK